MTKVAGKTVLVLGGGVGGLTTAAEARWLLGREHRIVLVEKEARHVFAPSLLWLMVGQREPGQIVRDLGPLTRRGIEVVRGEALAVDPAGRRVETTAGSLAYDYLVITPGAELAPDAVPGLAEAAHGFYDLESAVRCRDAVHTFPGGHLVVAIAGMPYKCPAAPYEAALLLDDFFARRGLRERVRISIYTPEPHPMPTAGPGAGQATREIVEGRGIAFHPGRRLAAVDGEARELAFEDGERVPYDLLLAVPPHRSPAVVRESGLAGETGWIPVDARTLRTGHDGVYALGDAAGIRLPGRFKPDVPLMLPKAGVFAHAQAEVVAANIAAEIQGRPGRREFDGLGYCFLEMGRGIAGFASGHFFAEPAPDVRMKRPGRVWHTGKTLFERYWLTSLGTGRWADATRRWGKWLVNQDWTWRWF